MAVQTQRLSDKSVLTAKSTIVSRVRQYADLDLSLTINPNFNDISPLLDIDAVKNAVKILVLTNFYERPFQPQLAGNISGFLFEPADRFTIISMRHAIEHVLAKYEQRIDSVTVQISDNSDNDRYDITLGFRVIALDQKVDVSIYLQRLH